MQRMDRRKVEQRGLGMVQQRERVEMGSLRGCFFPGLPMCMFWVCYLSSIPFYICYKYYTYIHTRLVKKGTRGQLVYSCSNYRTTLVLFGRCGCRMVKEEETRRRERGVQCGRTRIRESLCIGVKQRDESGGTGG